MKLGTKSVLYGAHCFFIHPWFVALAWWKLYGFPWDPRLWVAFFVHDLGYWGKEAMDSTEGEKHVFWGALLMKHWFDDYYSIHDYKSVGPFKTLAFWVDLCLGTIASKDYGAHSWYLFCLLHSRFYAKLNCMQFSKLCVADKLSLAITPFWLYLPMVWLTGEVEEYLEATRNGKYSTMGHSTASMFQWYRGMQKYLRQWAYDHRDLSYDHATPADYVYTAVDSTEET